MESVLMKSFLPCDIIPNVMSYLYKVEVKRGEDDFENPYHIKLRLKKNKKYIVQNFFSNCYICKQSFADLPSYKNNKYCYQYCLTCFQSWTKGTGPPPGCRKKIIIDTTKRLNIYTNNQYKDNQTYKYIMSSNENPEPTNDENDILQDPKQQPLSEFEYVAKWSVKFGKYKLKNKTFGDLAGLISPRGADKDYLVWCYNKGMWDNQKFDSNEKIKAFVEDYVINKFKLLSIREEQIKNYLEQMKEKLGDDDFTEFIKTY